MPSASAASPSCRRNARCPPTPSPPPRLRRRPPRRGRRQRVQPSPGQAPRGRPAPDPRRPRRLRQSAPRLRLQGARRQQPAAPRDHRRRRHSLRPRTARRPLLRPAPRVEQDHGEAWNTMRYTRDEVARVARIAFQLASKRRNKAHQRRQGQRPRSLAALARHRH
jgi:hypothetical protein